jgi:hypothetical protein
MVDRQRLIPSSFLPHLPRSQSSFEPLDTADLLAHIAILRELYVPPVHGGLDVRDCFYESEDEDQVKRDLTATNGKMNGAKGEDSSGLEGGIAGLGLSINLESPGTSSSKPIPTSRGYTGNNNSPEEEEQEEEEQYEDEEEESREHLDPFERDWSEKWLNGVVRRSQGWLEENEESGDVGEIKEMESLLRDASAALAIMAGTSG